MSRLLGTVVRGVRAPIIRQGDDIVDITVNAVLEAGLRTADMMADGCTKVGCTAMGDAILERI